MAYSKAQNEATKRYRAKPENKARTKYNNYKTMARAFVNNHATEEDLQMIIDLAQGKLSAMTENKTQDLQEPDK